MNSKSSSCSGPCSSSSTGIMIPTKLLLSSKIKATGSINNKIISSKMTTLILIVLISFYLGRLSSIVSIQNNVLLENSITAATTTSTSCDDNNIENNNNNKNSPSKVGSPTKRSNNNNNYYYNTLRRQKKQQEQPMIQQQQQQQQQQLIQQQKQKQQQQSYYTQEETQQHQPPSQQQQQQPPIHNNINNKRKKSSRQQQQQTIDLLPHLEDCNINIIDDDQQSNTQKLLLSLSELAQIYKPTKFVGFAHTNYDRIYPFYFEHYRNKKFRLLEIGLDTGKGSLLWKEYFPCATIYGLEYSSGKTQTEGAKNIYKTIQGDQGDAEFLLSTTFMEQTDGGNFDIIIDDGGHHYEQQSTSYKILFEKALNPGGLYIIEDIETSYWESGSKLYGKTITRGGCTGNEQTIVNKFKQLIDVINKKFVDYTKTVFGDVDYWVSTITFMSNLIILRKKDLKHCHSELQPYSWPYKLDKSCPARYQQQQYHQTTTTTTQPNNNIRSSPSLFEYCQEEEILK